MSLVSLGKPLIPRALNLMAALVSLLILIKHYTEAEFVLFGICLMVVNTVVLLQSVIFAEILSTKQFSKSGHDASSEMLSTVATILLVIGPVVILFPLVLVLQWTDPILLFAAVMFGLTSMLRAVLVSVSRARSDYTLSSILSNMGGIIRLPLVCAPILLDTNKTAVNVLIMETAVVSAACAFLSIRARIGSFPLLKLRFSGVVKLVARHKPLVALGLLTAITLRFDQWLIAITAKGSEAAELLLASNIGISVCALGDTFVLVYGHKVMISSDSSTVSSALSHALSLLAVSLVGAVVALWSLSLVRSGWDIANLNLWLAGGALVYFSLYSAAKSTLAILIYSENYRRGWLVLVSLFLVPFLVAAFYITILPAHGVYIPLIASAVVVLLTMQVYGFRAVR